MDIELKTVNGTLVVSSRQIAEKFGKSHKNVLTLIERVTSEVSSDFNRLNFKPITYIDSKNRSQPEYLLTRDGFSMVAMGLTGFAAVQWKERFIQAFNAMEQALLAKQVPPAQTPHEQTHLTLAQACATFGWQVPDEEWCVRMGQLASIVAMVLNYESKRVPHPKYGSVNAQHKAVWEELNTDFDSFCTTETMNKYLLTMQKDLSDTRFRFNIPIFNTSDGSPLAKLSRNLVKSA